ncbi:type VI secretion system baseplate subunit TssK [Ramlibacter alkalitolerans]|uniref:Type VI secretion system baseplate subunit TssK n=1 Tax=Ramlibacter alkalitolerans TaxID=2039631 RepID=A0ABS1JUS1_9BURK|nr:type VI secretion system baseplate subunit TssK [Ramlibacter alkalitolerans]MBL0427998.1 type VI secretion system baseplate subunit TssK [Ramlibacter alkalitolerans]
MNSRVLWSQGMFLLPHHFQQEARHVEYEAGMRLRANGAHAWGFFELALDKGLLAVGRVGISRASGILPDGTCECMECCRSGPAERKRMRSR